MVILRIEHPVPDYQAWKSAFDSDPVGRQRAGVRSHRVMRAVDDPAYVLIDLEFASAGEAQAMLERLRRLWGQVEGQLIEGPRAHLVEVAEAVDYASGGRQR